MGSRKERNVVAMSHRWGSGTAAQVRVRGVRSESFTSRGRGGSEEGGEEATSNQEGVCQFYYVIGLEASEIDGSSQLMTSIVG